jgi:shikimate dehydrogenase
MKKYGLVGKKLNYSYSQIIHRKLAELLNIDMNYELIEVDNLEDIDLKEYNGLNITIPFKKEVLEYLKSKDESVAMTDCCNTIDQNGCGYNTDLAGFEYLLASICIDTASIKRVVVLGDGAMSKMLELYFKDCEVHIVSRKKDNIEDNDLIYGDLLINTTPLGMGELHDQILINEACIKNFSAVIDLNYNPIINRMLNTAAKYQIVNANGLCMLIFQAVKAFEIWNDVIVGEEIIGVVKSEILELTTNGIAIIGMPLSGKSHYFSNVIKQSGEYVDVDDYIEKKINDTIFNYINKNGEKKFRDLETASLQEIVDKGYKYIACGGGIVERFENRYILRNYQIKNISKPFDELLHRYRVTNNNRPLLQDEKKLEETFVRRYALYNFFQNTKGLCYEDKCDKWTES